MMEIRVWAKDSNRILSLAVGFSLNRNTGRSQYGVDVGGGNPGMDRKLEKNIEFGCGILNKTKYCERPIGSGC